MTSLLKVQLQVGGLQVKMATQGRIGRLEKERQDREKLVKDYYGKHNMRWFVNKEVFLRCYNVISQWINIPVLLPYMMKYGLVVTQDDNEKLISPYFPPEMRRKAVLDVAERGADNGYFILYMCIRESRHDNPYGHGDATVELERCAEQLKVRPSWEAQPRNYQRPGEGVYSQEETEHGVGTAGDLPPHGPAAASTVQDIVASSVSKVGGDHNFQKAGRRKGYDKQPNSGTVTHPVQETSASHVDVPQYNLPPSDVISNVPPQPPLNYDKPSAARFSDPNYRGDEVEHDAYVYSNTGGATGSSSGAAVSSGSPSFPREKYQRWQEEEKRAKESHDYVKQLVENGKAATLDNNRDKYSVYFVAEDECNDKETLCQTAARFVAASLNSRSKRFPGVFIAGVDDNNYSVPGLNFLTVNSSDDLKQFLLSNVVCQKEEADDPRPLGKDLLSSTVIVDCVLPASSQSARVLLVTVHPSWELCDTLVYRCCYRNKNGQMGKMEPAHRLMCDDDSTSISRVAFSKIRDNIVKGFHSYHKK